jgi:hypothetical protein
MEESDLQLKYLEILNERLKATNQKKMWFFGAFIIVGFTLFVLIKFKQNNIQIAGINLNPDMSYIIGLSPLLLFIIFNTIQSLNSVEEILQQKINKTFELLYSKFNIKLEKLDYCLLEIPDFYTLTSYLNKAKTNKFSKFINDTIDYVIHSIFFLFMPCVIGYFINISFAKNNSIFWITLNIIIIILLLFSLIQFLITILNLMDDT